MPAKELLILFTMDPRKETERAALALAIAVAAQVSETPVSIYFAQDGVFATVKDGMKGLVAPEFAPLEEMMTILREEGAQFHVCHPFLAPRNLRMEDLLEGMILSSAVGLVQEGVDAAILTF